MNYLQSSVFKIILVTGLVWVLQSVAPDDAFTQGKKLPLRAVLLQADTLFREGQYTQSYNLYDSIYNHGGLTSADMLLKMAYIKEGLGDYTTALYHLYEYYNLTSNERALQKMAQLADQHKLVGYDYTDSKFLLSVYHDNYDYLVYALVAMSLVFLGGMLYQRLRLGIRPVTNYVLFALAAIALAIVVNIGSLGREAIVTHSSAYLMSGPSSSSEVVAILGKGNKIPIQASKDVWFQTTWNDEVAFVKKKNVMPVSKR